MQHSASYVLSLLLFLIALVIPVHSQSATGSLRGIVSDPSKAIITGAKITITNKGNGAAARNPETDAARGALRTHIGALRRRFARRRSAPM